MGQSDVGLYFRKRCVMDLREQGIKLIDTSPEIEKILELVSRMWRARVKGKKDIAEIEALWKLIDEKRKLK